MRSITKVDEGKPKNGEVIREIYRVVEANRLKLQHLELAVANLTSICSALRNDAGSLGDISVQGGSVGKVQAEVKLRPAPSRSRSSSPEMDLKDQMLGLQMQQLVDQATALRILKNTKTIPTKVSVPVKFLRASARIVPKNVQATTTTQKSSTKALVQTKESTTQKKLNMKLGAVTNMGATQPKGKSIPRSTVKTKQPTTAAKVSVKSTVKKTTISEVTVTNKNKETSRSNISVKSSVQNVETTEHKGSIKLKIQGDKSQNATKSRDLIKTSSSSGAGTIAELDLKPRRRWSTTKETTLIK